ncbi:MAG TPA: 2Fe-2S iron-sulfur cluster-binding protein [Solirubrobacteraceae bacterium]|jgi:isoquinoline 1-oxidoreductase alpha subunit
MPTHTFVLNGERVSVEVEDDVRLLWVLRDVLGVTGPKYGCGIGVCRACTCHVNGKAFTPCCVPVSDIEPTDRITTIEGLPATVGASCIRCRRPGSTSTSRSAATASPARSWPPWRW